MPTTGDGRSLPRKEGDLFKQIVKFYETKQYKKGLKAADAILKKYPNHGETLAMRGLVLNCLDRKEEAYDQVKEGLRADMRSHVCWHVYGLLHRSDRNYMDAIKSYKQALRIDPDNIQILRDLSLLQVQMRDRSGFLATRGEILRLKSTNKMHWVAYALACHLAGTADTAVNVIDAYLDTTANTHKEEDRPSYEDSELALYRNRLLDELGQYQNALDHLDACKHQVVDLTAWALKRAELSTLLLLDDNNAFSPQAIPLDTTSLDNLLSQDTAIAAWTRLLAQTPTAAENYVYHRGLQVAVLTTCQHPSLQSRAAVKAMLSDLRACQTPTDILALDQHQSSTLNKVYILLQEAQPRTEALRWLPVTYANTKAEFIPVINQIIIRQLRKGAPSLGSSLERLFEAGPRFDHDELRGASCCKLVLAIIEKHIASLKDPELCRFLSLADLLATLVPDARENEVSMMARLDISADKEPPSSLLWALYLKSHCLEWLGDLEEALTVISECLQHTPTAVDMYEKEARILKRCGDLEAAATAMDAARQLDLADRYVNNKSIKYFLRCGRIQEARKSAALFTRPEARDAEKHLRDMQASWYELELGQALAREKKTGPALRQFTAVIQHFSDFIEDQFDFHTYCIRKMTLRAYVDMLRFEERIRGHASFRAAAQNAARIWLELYDEKSRLESLKEAEAQAEQKRRAELAELASRDPEAAKVAQEAADSKSAEDAAAAKAKAKRDKMKQRKAKKAQDKAAIGTSNGESTSQTASGTTKKSQEEEDDDTEGIKLLATAREPLVEANDLVVKLNEYASRCAQTHALAFDVALRRHKPLVALRALKRLSKTKAQPYDAARRSALYKREPPQAALIERLAFFVSTVSLDQASSPIVREVMNAEMKELCQTDSDDWRAAVTATIQRFADQEPGLPSRTAATRALARLKNDTPPSAQLILTASLVDTKNSKPFPVDAFISARDALELANVPQSDIETFLAIARDKFPRATAFSEQRVSAITTSEEQGIVSSS